MYTQTLQIAPFKKNYRESIYPPSKAAKAHGFHAALRHANFQICQKIILDPPPRQILGTPLMSIFAHCTVTE